MESEVPPTEPSEPTAPVAPIAPSPTAVETAHERHTREFTHSVEVLEDSVEHGLVRMLKLAVPAVLALIVAAVGSYLLGQHLRDRSEQRRVDRAIRKARAEVTRRARAALADAS
jgi:hypothetical protein